MKMSQYKSVMFTVSICLSSILLAILVAYACDLAELEKAKGEAARAYHDAQQALIDYESDWLNILLNESIASYLKKLNDLQSDVNEKSAAYKEAREAYEACANPPERYTFTDYGGYVYEFSTKEAYNDFLRNRGYSTI